MYKEDNIGLHASGRPMFHSLRLFYGEYGSLLEDYVVIEDIRMGYIDHFEMVWSDDEHVTIKVIPSINIVENGVVQTYEVESCEFNFATETLLK